MWGSLLKAVAHVAVSHAVKERQAQRLAEGAPATAEAAPPPPIQRPRPGFPALAVVLGMIGFCCLSTGLLSELGSTTRLLDTQIEYERSQAFASMITGFALCIFPAVLMLGIAIGSYGSNRFEKRLVTLVETHPTMPLDDMAKSLGTTPERVRAVWRAAVDKNYVDGRGDLFAAPPAKPASAPPTQHTRNPEPRAAPLASGPPVPLASPSPSPSPPIATPLARGTQRWTGTCPSCRAAVEVLLFPGMRPRCPACRASLGFQA